MSPLKCGYLDDSLTLTLFSSTNPKDFTLIMYMLSSSWECENKMVIPLILLVDKY